MSVLRSSEGKSQRDDNVLKEELEVRKPQAVDDVNLRLHQMKSHRVTSNKWILRCDR